MTKEMLLALGAMILLSIVIRNVTQNSLSTEDSLYNSNFGVLATSLGISVMEDASRLCFDSTSDTSNIIYLTDLTTPANLGIDAGEDANNRKSFNDFDDFNGYSIVDSSMPSAKFNISATVCYINPSSPDNAVNTQSWHKKITVKVWSPSMQDTVVQASIFSYWNYK